MLTIFIINFANNSLGVRRTIVQVASLARLLSHICQEAPWFATTRKLVYRILRHAFIKDGSTQLPQTSTCVAVITRQQCFQPSVGSRCGTTTAGGSQMGQMFHVISSMQSLVATDLVFSRSLWSGYCHLLNRYTFLRKKCSKKSQMLYNSRLLKSSWQECY